MKSLILRGYRPALVVVGLLMAAVAQAAVPSALTADGVLTSQGGGPVADGNYTVTFSIYKDAAGGAPVWSEGPLQVAVKNGAFSQVLGAVKPVDAGVAAAGGWITLAVGNDPELARKPWRSVPFALRAQVAEGLECSGCVSGAMLDPQVLAPFAKSADLSGYAKSVDLGAYAKAASLADVAKTGNYADLQGAPTLAKLGTSCGSGLVVKGLKADGSLECVAGLVGGKCGVGEVVREVKVDGGVVCGQATVVGGKCLSGQVVTEVKADGSVVCGQVAIVGGACAAGEYVAGVGANGTPTCIKPAGNGCSLTSPAPGVALLACGANKVILARPFHSIVSSSDRPSAAMVDSNGLANIGDYWVKGPNGELMVSAAASSVYGFGIAADGSVVPLKNTVAFDPCGLLTVPGGTYDKVKISPYDFACAWSTITGNASCWGKYLPLGATWPSSRCAASTVPIQSPPGPVAALSVTGQRACAVLANGTLACWGAAFPASAKPPAGQFKSVAMLTAGGCAIKSDGSTACWGFVNESGTVPVPALPAGKYALLVDGIDDFVCGLREDKAIACSGSHSNSPFAPVVAPVGQFDLIAAKWGTVCGISQSGSTSCVLSNTQLISFDSPQGVVAAGIGNSGVRYLLGDGILVEHSTTANTWSSINYLDVGGSVF